MSNCKIQSIKEENSLEWIDVTNPTLQTLKKIQKKVGFSDSDINDTLSVTHRSKINAYDDYTFVIFLYPVYIKKTREITDQEFDFWISKKYLISAHRDKSSSVAELFKECKKNSNTKERMLNLPTEKLLYEIHLKLINYCLPMINHLDIDIDHIEKMIFTGHEKKMVKEISIIRRNITDYRKIVEPHKNILEKLRNNFQLNKTYDMKKNDIYFDSLIDYAQDIWNTLDSYKERIEALQETNESLISFRINDTVSLLTIISLIAFPATLIASIFGTNTKNAPITNFWDLIIFMVIVGTFLSLIWFIRSKRVLK